MVSEKLKYVRIKDDGIDAIIIFPEIIQHNRFKYYRIISAGFCNIGNNKVMCYGESVSLDLKSQKEDSEIATKQVYGYDY